MKDHSAAVVERYHLHLRRYVMIDLKIEEFKPEFAGKMQAIADKRGLSAKLVGIGSLTGALAETKAFDEPLQRLCVELKAKSANVDWESLHTELHSQQFFGAGPLLRALQCERPCVLLIDELDKVDHAFEALLLELLSVWQLSIRSWASSKPGAFRSLC